MNGADTQVLSLLEAISGDGSRTQRDLARLTGLNVAKVNFLLKRLAQKGHVKLDNVSRSPNKLRYLYVLTPQGVMERTRLTYRFMRRALRDYGRIESEVRSAVLRMRAEGARTLVLLGATEITEIVIRQLDDLGGFEVLCVADHASAGSILAGHEVRAVVDAPLAGADRVVACRMESSGLPDLLGVPDDRLVYLTFDGTGITPPPVKKDVPETIDSAPADARTGLAAGVRSSEGRT